MFGSVILEVAIGLVFVYLLLSLICSAAKEGIEALMKRRAIELERGIREMLGGDQGQQMLAHLYNHPLIDGLFQGEFAREKGGRWYSNLPSYIPAANFAVALLDVVWRGPHGAAGSPPWSAPSPPWSGGSPPGGPLSAEGLRQAIAALPEGAARRALMALLDQAEGDLDRLRHGIEAWYDSTMDRIAGWYKRWSQWVIFGVGLVLVLVLNVDTIALANGLTGDPSQRTALVAAAQEALKHRPEDAAGAPEQRLKANLEQMRGLGLPLGWNWNDPRTWPQNCGAWFLKAVGLLLTAFAIMLGAPFWFDVLNKFMVVRSTVKPREKSPPEGSKDRRPAGAEARSGS